MIKKLILIFGILTLWQSCGLEDLGKSECAIYIEDTLDSMQESYQTEAYDNNVDDEGNRQSLKTCLRVKQVTEKYLTNLASLKEDMNGRLCSGEEILRLTTRIEKKEQDLNRDLIDVWNDCEKTYGSD